MPRVATVLLATALLATGLFACATVTAQRVETIDPGSGQRSRFRARYELSSAGELEQGGWWHWSGGRSVFDGEIATIGGDSYEEWMQRPDKRPSVWWSTIDNDHGFRIDVRMRVVQAGRDCGGLGLWIHDGARMVKVHFRDGSVGFGYPFGEFAPVETARFHVYTVEGRGDWVRISVDGDPLVERQGQSTMTGAGTQTLTFGNLGGCAGVGEWDWLAYDTRPQLPARAQQVVRPLVGEQSFRGGRRPVL